MLVDVQWIVIGFPVWFVFGVVQVESITSKKFTTFKFTSAVIFRSTCSKILCNSFLVLSSKRADLLIIIAKPSSLYKGRCFPCQTSYLSGLK
jgi:hypothetical protein